VLRAPSDKVRVEVFWNVTQFSVVIGCQRFWAPC